MESLTIERRFRGPHSSGNGGYACGLAATGRLNVRDGHAAHSAANARGLFFNGYESNLSGQMRMMRFGARSIAAAVKRELAA